MCHLLLVPFCCVEAFAPLDLGEHQDIWETFIASQCALRIAQHLMSLTVLTSYTIDSQVLSSQRSSSMPLRPELHVLTPALITDLTTLCTLQVEFGLFLDRKALRSRHLCEGLLVSTVQPLVSAAAAVAASADASASESSTRGSLASMFDVSGDAPVAKAPTGPTLNDEALLARVFRLSELLGLSRTFVRGVLAREAVGVGDVVSSLSWCKDMSVNTVVSGTTARLPSDSEGSRALRLVSSALTTFANGHPEVFHLRSHTASKHAKCRARSHQYAEYLLRHSVCSCSLAELPMTLSQWQATDMVASVLAKSEVGDYGRLWEVDPTDDLADLGAAGPMSTDTSSLECPSPFAHWFRETTTVMKTSKAMTLATRCSAAAHRIRQEGSKVSVGDGTALPSLQPLVSKFLRGSVLAEMGGTPSQAQPFRVKPPPAPQGLTLHKSSPLEQLRTARDSLVNFLEESGCLQLAVHVLLSSMSSSLHDTDVHMLESVSAQLLSKVKEYCAAHHRMSLMFACTFSHRSCHRMPWMLALRWPASCPCLSGRDLRRTSLSSRPSPRSLRS